MNSIRLLFCCLVFTSPAVCSAQSGVNKDTLQLVLPSECYASPGTEMSIYFDNIVLTETPESYRFDVKCGIGKIEKRRWSVTPKPEDVGSHDWTVTVFDRDEKEIAHRSTKLQVAPRDAGEGTDIRLLIVGDSLTNASQYPNEIARLLSRPSNPNWKMLGTHKPGQAGEGVVHEGYGGWTWKRFVSYYELQPNKAGRKHQSPFVYLDDDEKPQLDVAQYMRVECENDPPDFVVFMLGINDCFGAPPEDPEGIDRHIDKVFEQARILVAAFRKAAPNAEIGICVTTPPNAREAAFQANYQDRYHRWGWKRIQHQLIQRQMTALAGRDKNNVFIVPTQLNLDPIDGYPAGNGVHPNTTGYQQIGSSIYAWLKWRLAEASR